MAVILLRLLLSVLAAAANAQSDPGPINLTAVLEDQGGQFTVFTNLLNISLSDIHLNNISIQGMTLFAPTDNAFQNLPPETLNSLSPKQKEQLVQNHICPKYYSLTALLSVSNPVRTLTTGQKGGVFGLNFTGKNNQVNVSTAAGEVPVSIALREDFPLTIYQVDKVLMPHFSHGSKSGTADATPPSTSNPSGRTSVGMGLVSAIWLLCMGLLS